MKAIRMLFLILCILIFSSSVLAEQLKEYCPCPIIFVHGYKTKEPSTWDCWKTAKSNIKRYFEENGECKYLNLDGKEKYFPTVNYGMRKTGPISRNGNIPDIAKQVLLPRVEWTLDNCFPASYPESERKVIIVAHSMGGLIVRSLLTQFSDYQNKIDRVVFVDTPHLGSPYASAVWIVDKEAKEILPPLVKKYSTFFAKSVGALRFLLGPTGTAAPEICGHISWNLQKRLNRDNFLLWITELGGTDPDGYAIDKMRLPFQSEYHDVVTGHYGLKHTSVPIDIVYGPSETFLGIANLAVPSTFKVIRGEIPPSQAGAVKFVKNLITLYREGYPLGFSFESDYTLNDAISTGDGIVSKLSQERMNRDAVGQTDYEVDAWHGAAPEKWQTILQAVEDKPEIESVRTVPVDWSATFGGSQEYYLIFKVKDYLLADIEIETLILNGVDIIPENFKKDSKAKPYYAFGKDFLKQREDISATFKNIYGNKEYLKLKPGEFYIKTTIPLNAAYVKLKIKNPAAEYAQEPEDFSVERTFYFRRPDINISWAPLGRLYNPGNPYTSLYGIDLPPFDEENGGSDDRPNQTYLTLNIENSSSLQVVCSAFFEEEGVFKKTLLDKAIFNLTVDGSGPYEGLFSDAAAFNGTDDSGQYPDYSMMPAIFYYTKYSGKIIIVPLNDPDPADDIIPFLTFTTTSIIGDRH